tara:strand:+ start:146 stop:454 length:309 start_codon:yes stop_codon:yes gene_type:complete
MNKSVINKIKELGLVAEDHWLKPRLQVCYTNANDMSVDNGTTYQDFKNIGDDIRLIGTKDQISKFWKNNDLQVKDTWDSVVTEKHLNMYIKNLNNLVVIGLI